MHATLRRSRTGSIPGGDTAGATEATHGEASVLRNVDWSSGLRRRTATGFVDPEPYARPDARQVARADGSWDDAGWCRGGTNRLPADQVPDFHELSKATSPTATRSEKVAMAMFVHMRSGASAANPPQRDQPSPEGRGSFPAACSRCGGSELRLTHQWLRELKRRNEDHSSGCTSASRTRARVIGTSVRTTLVLGGRSVAMFATAATPGWEVIVPRIADELHASAASRK